MSSLPTVMSINPIPTLLVRRASGHRVDDHGAAFLLSFVQVSMLVVRRDGVAEHVRVQLHHMRFVAADAGDVAAFLPAFRVGQVGGGEEGNAGWDGAEDDVGGAHEVFQKALVFCMTWREDVLLRLAVVFFPDLIDEVGVVGLWVVESHDTFPGALEVARYDVQVMDLVRPEEHGESDVPVGLLACTEDARAVRKAVTSSALIRPVVFPKLSMMVRDPLMLEVLDPSFDEMEV
ncbi:NAD(P)-binding protein [Hortaea werneckii]|nr:NAD(P)-binding protein [Hortaea werneckii]